MRIAGVYSQKRTTDAKIQHAVDEPYGLEKILAVAKEAGHDVELFVPDERENKFSERVFAERIGHYKPDVAAFSLYTCQYDHGWRTAYWLKRAMPNAVTVAGNRYPSFVKNNMWPFDFFVVGEGEETFRELLYELENGKRYERVAGLSFTRNFMPFFTGERERTMDLDKLPVALRFPVVMSQEYKGISLPTLSQKPHYAIVEYSRSCSNACKFCDNKGFWGGKIVFRSPERTVDELFSLQEQGIDIFYFIDLNFTAVPERTLALCDEMKRRNFHGNWYCMSNIATVDGREELLDALKETGCYKIAWGVESTNNASLDKMEKKTGLHTMKHEQVVRVLDSSLRHGLLNQGYYIIGFPWETAESIVRDAERVKELPLHQLNIGIFTPIPLSRFYTEMMEQGYSLNPDLSMHDRNTLVYNHGSIDPDTMKSLQEHIYRDFYKSEEYVQRLERTCAIEPRFRQSFNEYFDHMRMGVRV